MFRAVATTSLSFSLILNKLPAVEKKTTMNLGVANLTFEGKILAPKKIMQTAIVEKKS